VDVRRETLTRSHDRPEHHGEVATAHLGLRQARELGQPSPERFVVAAAQEAREPMIERLVVREGPRTGSRTSLCETLPLATKPTRLLVSPATWARIRPQANASSRSAERHTEIGTIAIA